MVQETLLANPDEKYSIICSNIENFKVYNDNYGMKAGDLLLQDLAKAIRRRLETIVSADVSAQTGFSS